MNTEINTVVAVLGPGAIGTTVAAALHEVGRTPLLCGRTPRDSLTLQDGNRFITVPGPVQTNPAQITRTVDLIFLAVKSTQIDAAAEWLRALTGPETVICVLQNGVEQLDRLATYSLPGQSFPLSCGSLRKRSPMARYACVVRRASACQTRQLPV